MYSNKLLCVYLFSRLSLYLCAHICVCLCVCLCVCVCACLSDWVDYRKYVNFCQSISVHVGGGQMQPKSVFLKQGKPFCRYVCNTHTRTVYTY